MTAPARADFRHDINGLRAIAVGLVLLYHFRVPGISGGYVGVDCFFVISGYLMTKLIDGGLDGGRFSLLRFYQARAIRIIPALGAMLVAVLAFGYVAIEPGRYADMGESAAAAALFVSDWKFALEKGYFHPTSETDWLLHTWSLSTEWQFYLAYPILYLVLSRFPLLWRRRLAVLAGLALLSFAMNVVAVAIGGRLGTFAFFLMPLRAWEMMAGGIVYLIAARSGTPGGRWLEPAGLALILIAALAFDRASPWPSYRALLPVVGTAMVILAARQERSMLRWRPVQAIGLWSYSIYLWHWPLAVGAGYFLFAHDAITVLGGLALSVLLGWLSYRLVENPTRGMAQKVRGTYAPLRGTGLAAMACFAVAVAIVLAGGLPGRARGDVALIADSRAAPGEWAFPAECQGMRGPSEDLRCFTRRDAEPALVVIGDSHAQMLYPVLAGSRYPAVEFVSTVGCAPVPDLERRENGFNCAAVHRKAVEQVLASPARAVLYASIWVPYLDYANDEGQGMSCLVAQGGGCQPIRSEADALTALSGLRTEILALQAAGKSVTVVQPFPAPHRDIPFEVRDGAFRGRDVAAPVRLDERSPAEELVRRFIASLAADGVSVIDPRDAMCSGGVCPVTNPDGTSLYMDGNHLRPAAMVKLDGLFDGLLDTLRPREAPQTPVANTDPLAGTNEVQPAQ